jgi:hypothetical protein
MKQIFMLTMSLWFMGTQLQAQQTVQERLGYPADAKLLIVHADDLGVIHSANQATFKAFKEGSVNSASIMVPTPWFIRSCRICQSQSRSRHGYPSNVNQ